MSMDHEPDHEPGLRKAVKRAPRSLPSLTSELSQLVNSDDYRELQRAMRNIERAYATFSKLSGSLDIVRKAVRR